MGAEDPEGRSQALRRAEKRVEEKLGFYRHLTVYLAVNAFLLALNLVVSPDFLWFLIPLAGWGVGLFVHFMTVFAFGGEKVEEWRQREIRKELEKLNKKG